MKIFLITIVFIFFIQPFLFCQENKYNIKGSIGYLNSFHQQVGVEGIFEFERKIAHNWMGIYFQERVASLDNHNSSLAPSNSEGFLQLLKSDVYVGKLSTTRLDTSIGIHQYFSNNPKDEVFLPYVGIGAFVSFQKFEEELSANNSHTSHSQGIGAEWEIGLQWSIRDSSFGVSYQGTYSKIKFFSEDIYKYENHFSVFYGFNY